MSKEKFVCTQCGTVGNGKSYTRGGCLIELILWCCFIIPGLVYSLWRLSTRTKVCASCGAATLVPLDSPVGRKLAPQETRGT